MVEVLFEWMSGAIMSDYDINSKIRARLSTRNEQGYTAGAVGTRRSQRREQEVVLRKALAVPA